MQCHACENLFYFQRINTNKPHKIFKTCPYRIGEKGQPSNSNILHDDNFDSSDDNSKRNCTGEE